ncbi:MAG TPA: hypothetical protein VE987_03730 [Polyangiaceae bacterium]|nr:hypothetical protein [Polyangiaceae bacterium]
MHPRAIIPVARSARAWALTISLSLGALGVVAGAVRLLPWLLDPEVPWRVASPFARGLATVALEAAITVGWPVGWALACHRAHERGEARVLQTLGEPPARTIRRFFPHAVALAVALSTVAVVSGSDSNAPGRVATELIAQARASCVGARAPAAYVVPFTGLAWLCAPGRPPRLAGEAIGGLGRGVPGGGAVVTASDARIAGDFRALELDDARLTLPGRPPWSVHVTTLSMHGMSPWAHASNLPPALRALVLALTAWCAGSVAAYGVLRRAVRARSGAIALGAAGPIAALGLLRVLERADARPAVFLVLPLVACASAAAVALALAALARRRSRC